MFEWMILKLFTNIEVFHNVKAIGESLGPKTWAVMKVRDIPQPDISSWAYAIPYLHNHSTAKLVGEWAKQCISSTQLFLHLGLYCLGIYSLTSNF